MIFWLVWFDSNFWETLFFWNKLNHGSIHDIPISVVWMNYPGWLVVIRGKTRHVTLWREDVCSVMSNVPETKLQLENKAFGKLNSILSSKTYWFICSFKIGGIKEINCQKWVNWFLSYLSFSLRKDLLLWFQRRTKELLFSQFNQLLKGYQLK